MIRVRIDYIDNEQITAMKIEGHADYSEAGSDIVCAGVSSLVLSNLLYAEKNHLGDFKAEQAEGYIYINQVSNDTVLQHLLKAVVEGLEQIAVQYPNYLKIKKYGGD